MALLNNPFSGLSQSRLLPSTNFNYSMLGMVAVIKNYDKQVLREFKKAIRKGGRMIGKLVTDEAKRIIPRSEHGHAWTTTKEFERLTRGSLYKGRRTRNWHTADTIRFEWDEATQTVTIGTNYFVGRLLETGTIKMRKRPWLTPAVNNKVDEINDILNRVFMGAL